MPASIQPFPLPQKLPKSLGIVLRYWRDLIRAENTMPFADDVNLSELSKLADNLVLADVFATPQRFRFNYLSEPMIKRLHSNISGKFADELELHSPLNFFLAQSSATVEAKTPTYYACKSSGRGMHRKQGYSRLLFPTWGDGRVQLLIGVVA